MDTQTQTQTQTRRSFYSAVIYGLGALIAGALAIPAAVYLLIAPKSRRQGAMIEVANLAKLEIGKPQEVTFERTRVDGWRTFQNEKVIAWVVRTSDQAAVAYSPICTHLGCAYHWESEGNRFLCPCHGSAFSMDGKVLEGPAPRPLDRYVSKIEAGKLLIGSEIKKA